VLARTLRFFCAGSVPASCRRCRGDVLLNTNSVRLLGIYRSNVGTSSSHDAATSNSPAAAVGHSGCACTADLCISDQPRYGQGEHSDHASTNKIRWVHCGCWWLLAGEGALCRKGRRTPIFDDRMSERFCVLIYHRQWDESGGRIGRSYVSGHR
jgi:hypothetical protein